MIRYTVLQIPEKFGDDFNPGMTPEEYYGEMSPFFITTYIDTDDMGDHTQNHIKEHNISEVSESFSSLSVLYHIRLFRA